MDNNITPEKQNELTREILEAKVGRTWNTTELQMDYSVHGFLAPFVTVTRKVDGVKGTLEFTHMPRFYFNFIPD